MTQRVFPMQVFDFPPDQAIPADTPLNREVQFGGGYKQVIPEGILRKWQLLFVLRRTDLEDIWQFLESQNSVLWTQPAPHEKEGQYIARIGSRRSERRNGELKLIECEFVLELRDRLF